MKMIFCDIVNAKVAPTNLNIEVEQEDGVVEKKNDQHEDDTASKTHLGQSPDSMADTFAKDKKGKEVSEITWYDRNGGNASDHPDDSQLACWGDWQSGNEEM